MSGRKQRPWREFEQLSGWLSRRRWPHRAAAAAALRDVDDERADEALLNALEDKSFVVAQVALRSLVSRDATRELGPILAAFRRRAGVERTGPPDLRELVEYGIWAVPSADAAPTLVDALRSGERFAEEEWRSRLNRTLAIDALGQLGDVRAVEQLTRELESANEPTRRAAAEALGKLRTMDAVRPLRKALRDESAWVRHKAIDALAAVGGEEARLALFEVRRRGRLRDRLRAARAIRRGMRAPAG